MAIQIFIPTHVDVQNPAELARLERAVALALQQLYAMCKDLEADKKFGILAVSPGEQQAHIPDPSGGATQDAEARTAINSILAALEEFGLTASS